MKKWLLASIFLFLMAPVVMAMEDFEETKFVDPNLELIPDLEAEKAAIEVEEDEIEAMEAMITNRRKRLEESRAKFTEVRSRWGSLSIDERRKRIQEIREKRKSNHMEEMEKSTDEPVEQSENDFTENLRGKFNTFQDETYDREAEARRKRIQQYGRNNTVNRRNTQARSIGKYRWKQQLAEQYREKNSKQSYEGFSDNSVYRGQPGRKFFGRGEYRPVRYGTSPAERKAQINTKSEPSGTQKVTNYY